MWDDVNICLLSAYIPLDLRRLPDVDIISKAAITLLISLLSSMSSMAVGTRFDKLKPDLKVCSNKLFRKYSTRRASRRTTTNLIYSHIDIKIPTSTTILPAERYRLQRWPLLTPYAEYRQAHYHPSHDLKTALTLLHPASISCNRH